ncbi:MAG TPA: zf-TFIIB domain-containing protein [Abditibacterium sp.]|jgi:hypothetical protein
MKCPLDQTELLITERQGVEIDYCPTCRGVWLDRGELDKLIERAESYDRRDRSRDDDDYEPRREPPREAYRNEAPRNDEYRSGQPLNRPATNDIAGVVGEVLKKKFDERGRGKYDDDYHHGRKKKKGGLLGELFDF